MSYERAVCTPAHVSVVSLVPPVAPAAVFLRISMRQHMGRELCLELLSQAIAAC